METQENYIEKDNLIEDSDSNGFNFKFADQEGPLDLLLYLIKKNKLEIEDVKLADITDQYLEVVSKLEEFDLERASDFVVLAAELIEIKSKSLLPSLSEEGEEEEDPEELLRIRLKEYEMMKEMSGKLKEIEDVNKFYKTPEPDASKFRVVIKDMQLDMLLDAFTRIMLRTKKEEKAQEVKEVEKEKFTVEEKICTIKDSLISRNKIMFSELFRNTTSRGELITTFMALLELLKLQLICVKQDNLFEDIEIVKVEDDNDK